MAVYKNKLLEELLMYIIVDEVPDLVLLLINFIDHQY